MRKLKKQHQDKDSLELARLCAKVALDTKAEDLIVLDVHDLTSFTDFFIIMSGRSTRHVQGLAEVIESKLRSKRVSTKNCEGLKEGLWVLLDFNDVIVHIFYKESRMFYDLDGLWHDAPKVDFDFTRTEE
jgi:ribosome-associated protein